MQRLGEFAHSECYPTSPKWGVPGDQLMPKNPGEVFDGEVRIREFSDDNFTTIFRPVSVEVAESIAYNMEAAAKNPNVGYSQNNGASPRTSFYKELIAAGGDAAKITRPCNGDCSAGTAALLQVAGVPVSAEMWTGNAPEQLRDTRKILEIPIKNSSYYKYLLRGDILFRPGHMAIILDSGELEQRITFEATGDVWQRLSPGLNDGTQLYVIDRGADTGAYLPAIEIRDRAWIMTEYNGRRGWTSGRYLKPATVAKVRGTCYVRALPSIGGEVVYTADRGLELIATGAVKEDSRGVMWYQVMYDYKSLGWISSRWSLLMTI